MTDVLVVGAGPVGLTTALQVHAHGARVRVVDRRSDPFRPSRAMILHPRTLESLRPLGVVDPILERGDTAPSAELHLGRHTVRTRLDEVDLPDTAYPHLTLVRQADVEQVLLQALADRDVPIEWGTGLVDVRSTPGSARAVLDTGGRMQEVEARYVAGCDGPSSTVRARAGIGWRGAPYREEIVLADLEVDGLAPGALHVVAAAEGLVFLFALGELAPWRLLATRPARDTDAPYGRPGGPVPESDVRAILDRAGLDATVTAVRWSAAVRLQHRLADAFASGGLFLAGDAAHAHSPAAAQGMNTGILDAVNLGWKLAFAARHPERDHAVLLGSYEQERRPVARKVVALTHLVFFAEASPHPLPAVLRGRLMPLLAPAIPPVLRQRWVMAQVVRLLSQRWVRYRHSPLSVDSGPGEGGRPRPGDRLPDRPVRYDGGAARLHELTAAPGVHLLLDQDATLPDGLVGELVSAHRLTDQPGRGVLAVRPDGHVGLRSPVADGADLRSWLGLVAAR